MYVPMLAATVHGKFMHKSPWRMHFKRLQIKKYYSSRRRIKERGNTLVSSEGYALLCETKEWGCKKEGSEAWKIGSSFHDGLKRGQS
eukprot:3115136-Pleurochrysis_carterae.AAC.2